MIQEIQTMLGWKQLRMIKQFYKNLDIKFFFNFFKIQFP